MKSLSIRLITHLLSGIFLIIGYKIGFAWVFNIYDRISPTLGLAVKETSVLVLAIHVLLFLIAITFGGYLIYKFSLLYTTLITSKQLIRIIVLSLSAGFSFVLSYWFLLQVIAILFLINRS